MADYVRRGKVEFELCGGNLPEKYKAFVRRVLNDKNLVPAADVAEDMFLIYRDSKWNWIGMEKCKPYYLKVSEWANKKFVSTFCSCGERKE